MNDDTVNHNNRDANFLTSCSAQLQNLMQISDFVTWTFWPHVQIGLGLAGYKIRVRDRVISWTLRHTEHLAENANP